ncbi:uncharacterized protein LOC101757531 isoform X2 [Setaria italica]|uniref:uncharacterized protein LOC101757531 isoform X2 n=1 Tax=Setaria italica TaxID=4555 RepID=UPI0003509789|nr:uncharacterized protein LOC101757531 isoform X2 [Setaria italica]
MDCLGTQEPHSIGTSNGLFKDPHYQKSTFDQTSRANQQNGCSSNEVSKHNIGIAEVHFSRDDSSAEMTNLHPLLPCDYGSSVPTLTPCCSHPETVFSPNWKQDDPQTKAMYHNGAATDDNSEFLQLIFSDTYEGNSSSELQIWDILDLYFPESFAAVQFNTLMGFGNDDCSYNECVDAADMVAMGISPPDKTRGVDDATCRAPVDYTSFYLQNRPSDSENECSSASCMVTGYECTDNQELPVGLLNLMDIGSPGNSDDLSRPSLNTKNIVLVLDLDETLVHSKLQPCDNFDFTLQVFFNMEDHTVYVRQRPHLEMFLNRVAQMFEVVVFTASESVYAEPLLDKLDPDRKLISRRFYRESCTFSNGSYTKDLTIFGVDLAKVVIVDNTPQLQVDNGIPIKSWFDDPTDVELMELLQFLATLVDAKDVRPIISKNFNNKPQLIGSD